MNSPINLNDPSGHESICGQANSDPECEGVKHSPTPPVKQPSGRSGGGDACSGQHKSIVCLQASEPLTLNPELLLMPHALSDDFIVPSYEGYSNSDLDALYSFWNHAVTPINDLVSLDDIYRMSSSGGWKAGRYSLSLGIFEAVVQGSRQAYRDSWYQTLTPAQRFLRPIVVGTEALITDNVAGKVGAGFGAAGLAAGGPLGAAGGYVAGQTLTTNVMDKAWMKFNSRFLTNSLGVWP